MHSHTCIGIDRSFTELEEKRPCLALGLAEARLLERGALSSHRRLLTGCFVFRRAESCATRREPHLRTVKRIDPSAKRRADRGRVQVNSEQGEKPQMLKRKRDDVGGDLCLGSRGGVGFLGWNLPVYV